MVTAQHRATLWPPHDAHDGASARRSHGRLATVKCAWCPKRRSCETPFSRPVPSATASLPRAQHDAHAQHDAQSDAPASTYLLVPIEAQHDAPSTTRPARRSVRRARQHVLFGSDRKLAQVILVGRVEETLAHEGRGGEGVAPNGIDGEPRLPGDDLGDALLAVVVRGIALAVAHARARALADGLSHQGSSGVIRGHQGSSGVIRWSSVGIRGH